MCPERAIPEFQSFLRRRNGIQLCSFLQLPLRGAEDQKATLPGGPHRRRSERSHPPCWPQTPGQTEKDQVAVPWGMRRGHLQARHDTKPTSTCGATRTSARLGAPTPPPAHRRLLCTPLFPQDPFPPISMEPRGVKMKMMKMMQQASLPGFGFQLLPCHPGPLSRLRVSSAKTCDPSKTIGPGEIARRSGVCLASRRPVVRTPASPTVPGASLSVEPGGTPNGAPPGATPNPTKQIKNHPFSRMAAGTSPHSSAPHLHESNRGCGTFEI